MRSREFDEEVSESESRIRALKAANVGEAHWDSMPVGFQNPHCDFSMVHAPGECEACDECAFGLQHLRHINRVNYTGRRDPDKAPCPSEIFRSFESANRWGGNYAEVDREVPLQGTDEQKRLGRWIQALAGFQRFFKEDRELRELKRQRDELDQKIAQLDRSNA